jgi:hypothetical protein
MNTPPGAVGAEDVSVRGNATVDELAAVLAVLTELEARNRATNRYENWRRDRILALRTTQPR